MRTANSVNDEQGEQFIVLKLSNKANRSEHCSLVPAGVSLKPYINLDRYRKYSRPQISNLSRCMTDRFLNPSKSFTITYLRAVIGRIGMTSIFHLDIKRVEEVSVKDF